MGNTVRGFMPKGKSVDENLKLELGSEENECVILSRMVEGTSEGS